ncbi:bifunctional folylpolyglutamate synthase/dihydrofolate synthase [Sulfurovum sp. zt1-1]|uniref:Bifunctional folylpolyglutamate synthase/dihydrofolate synthase n=1 Tax=Sulfurovum zhangzhouensis TaxID=3019067 RepID=A0ABT7QX43_9BACT|nr:bifunctional folylpolyglutamate synthase/dihydrofolate synthase [Sulfurovum zhangzhouensis]MDM5271321.1 bifunctional folylpolyglutamate synthase/dihydrofolate synthase [Sulfurovum zhangzhouensis]
MSLQDFLEAKPLYYKEIDHERVHIAYGLLKPHISRPKTVHVVGTNGKGSTGRMLAHLAYKGGLKTGHYTSPHIIKFNERIWIDGEDASDEVLEQAHQKLYAILDKEMSESLSYFEYTTLLAFVVFEKCDLVVLEAGLGGEFDATNVCEKELSIITPIGIDHQAFLGQSIEEIATTKINSIQKQVVLAPQPYEEVVDVAQKIAQEKGAVLFLNTVFRAGHKRLMEKVQEIAKSLSWGAYLVENAMVALQALDILDIDYDIDDLESVKLFGRFYQLKTNIRIDVGHNPLAAQAIVNAMDPETVLIYNSLDDKDYERVLRTLKPKVKRVEIIKINSQRATTLGEIEQALQRVGLEYRYYEGTIKRDEHYLVFGSFYVVEEFLKSMESHVSK